MYLETKSSGEVKQDTFLSADALQITEPQRTALITVLGMMERGFLDGKFHMDYRSLTRCSSVCCIAGWADEVGDNCFKRATSWATDVGELFFPDNRRAIVCADPRRGALALRSYLATGFARWNLAMSAKLT